MGNKGFRPMAVPNSHWRDRINWPLVLVGAIVVITCLYLQAGETPTELEGARERACYPAPHSKECKAVEKEIERETGEGSK